MATDCRPSSASNHHLLLDMMDVSLPLESIEETFPNFDLDGQTLLLKVTSAQDPIEAESCLLSNQSAKHWTGITLLLSSCVAVNRSFAT